MKGGGFMASISLSYSPSEDPRVSEYLPLVKTIASKIHKKLPASVLLEDLVHEGVIGLIKALRKFDPRKNIEFFPYATKCIRGEILESLRRGDDLTKHARRFWKKIETEKKKFGNRFYRDPTEQEIAECLSMDLDEFREKIISFYYKKTVSHSSRPDKESKLPLPYITCHRPLPDKLCNEREVENLLATARGKLRPKRMAVISLLYFEDLSNKETAGFLGVNQSRSSQIHRESLEELSHILSRKGITSTSQLID